MLLHTPLPSASIDVASAALYILIGFAAGILVGMNAFRFRKNPRQR